MKANLANFANQFAAALGLPGWNVDANAQAHGGRVIVIEGDYFAVPEVHRRLIDLNATDGNQPVDMLMCVPPKLVKYPAAAEPRSLAAERLEGEGFTVWDGVSTTVRDSYPVSVAQLRIVQYDSCRGLEGWVVIALALDELYRYKRETWQPSAAEPGLFSDDPEESHRHAARWLMIPLSRAIDTLVVEIATKPSVVRDALLKVAKVCQDFVEWHQR
jgi:hypothetical protein